MKKLLFLLILCLVPAAKAQLGFSTLLKENETTPAFFFKPDFSYYSFQINVPFTVVHKDAYNWNRTKFSFSSCVSILPLTLIAIASGGRPISPDSGWGGLVVPALMSPFLLINSQHYINFIPKVRGVNKRLYLSAFVGSQFDAYPGDEVNDSWSRFTGSMGLELFVPFQAKPPKTDQVPGIGIQAGMSRNWDLNQTTQKGETKPFICIKLYWMPWTEEY